MKWNAPLALIKNQSQMTSPMKTPLPFSNQIHQSESQARSSPPPHHRPNITNINHRRKHQVYVDVPPGTRARDVTCAFRTDRVALSLQGRWVGRCPAWPVWMVPPAVVIRSNDDG